MKITNKFGTPHNLSGTHEGIDFIEDDLIVRLPFEKLRILFVGMEPSGLGNYLVGRWVDANKRTKLVIMGHFEEIYVKVGDLLWKGQKIGKMGKSGNAFGIHTHLELHAPIDPEPYLNK